MPRERSPARVRAGRSDSREPDRASPAHRWRGGSPGRRSHSWWRWRAAGVSFGDVPGSRTRPRRLARRFALAGADDRVGDLAMALRCHETPTAVAHGPGWSVLRQPILDRNRPHHRARAGSAVHKRAIALIRVLSVGARSGARRTPRRRSSARASNRPPARAPTTSSTWPEMKASLTAAGFGAQSAITIAHSARPRGRDQAHRVDHWSAPRTHHSRAAREPRVPRAPHAPGPRQRCPPPGKPPTSSASRRQDQPAVAKKLPGL